MSNESSVRTTINRNSIARKNRHAKVAALSLNLVPIVENETALAVLDLKVWKAIQSAEKLEGEVYRQDADDNACAYLSEDKFTLYVTAHDMTFSFTRPFDTIGLVLADMNLTPEQIESNIPVLLEVIDAMCVSYPPLSLSTHDAIVARYRKMMADPAVSVDVVNRLFTGRQIIHMTLVAKPVKTYTASNGVVFTIDASTVTVDVNNRTLYCRRNGSTIAEHLSRSNTALSTYEDAVRVCEALDELLTRYSIIK